MARVVGGKPGRGPAGGRRPAVHEAVEFVGGRVGDAPWSPTGLLEYAHRMPCGRLQGDHGTPCGPPLASSWTSGGQVFVKAVDGDRDRLFVEYAEMLGRLLKGDLGDPSFRFGSMFYHHVGMVCGRSVTDARGTTIVATGGIHGAGRQSMRSALRPSKSRLPASVTPRFLGLRAGIFLPSTATPPFRGADRPAPALRLPLWVREAKAGAGRRQTRKRGRPNPRFQFL